MDVAVLFSGGKDSTYSVYVAREMGLNVRFLVTLFPEREDSWMFHYPTVKVTSFQAEAMGIHHLTGATRGEKERELEDLKRLLKSIRGEVEGVVSGAIESFYQKSRIDRVCSSLGLKSIAPLWHRDPETLLREEINRGFKILITGVFAQGFSEDWLGRTVDNQCVDELKKLNRKFGVHLCGEGGEYETLVVDSPLFRRKLRVLEFKKHWRGNHGLIEILRVSLEEKMAELKGNQSA